MPQVVRRGCKRSLGPRVTKSSCTGAKESCTGATQGFGGEKDSWEGDLCTLGPKHLLHPLLTTLGTVEVSGPCSRTFGSQCLSHGNAPRVPWTFCPIYVKLHTNQVGTCQMCRGLAPKPSPGCFRGIPTTKSLYVFFVYPTLSVFSSREIWVGRAHWWGVAVDGGVAETTC